MQNNGSSKTFKHLIMAFVKTILFYATHKEGCATKKNAAARCTCGYGPAQKYLKDEETKDE